MIMEAEVIKRRLVRELRGRYGVESSPVRLVFAPYRICPLGAHIDHQLGSVTAMAVDRGVLLAYAPLLAREVRLTSLEFPGEVRFDLEIPGAPQAGDWGNYARGAGQALAQSGYALRRGLVGIVTGPWSEGGLGSSAAVGVAYLLALEDVNTLSVEVEKNILLDQGIENGYLGLQSGILDQSGILLSRRDHLTYINCATTRHQLIPAAHSTPPWSLVLAFSGLKKALVGTDYNRRVAECRAAARILLDAAGRADEAPLLGRVHPREYTEHQDRLTEPLSRRAAHFFSEVERVHRGAEAWRQGNLREFGRLMTASGESSIRNYECGCPPLVDLYRILIQCDGIYGARFSGAGFRGCCIGLVARAHAAEAAAAIERAYAECQPHLAAEAFVVVCHSDDGARFLDASCAASESEDRRDAADATRQD
jgi:galactokinase